MDIMGGTWSRCFYRRRFRTLLVLGVALYVSTFIVLNNFILPSEDQLDDDSPKFTFLKSGKSDVVDHLLKDINRDHKWDVQLKEFPNDDSNDKLYKKALDSQLERSTSTNNVLNSYHSEENGEQDVIHFPNNVKQNEFKNDQRAVVDRLTSSSLHPQSKENKGFQPENSTTHLIKNSSLTDERNKLITPGIQLKSSMNIKRPKSAIPSNAKGAKNAAVTESGIGKQSAVSVAQSFSTTIAPLTQEIIDSIAANMKVRFEVLEGFDRAVITLRNNGSEPIERSQWSIYVCITTGMELGHLVHKTKGYILPQATSIKLTHLNGCSYKVEPTKDFTAILPGKSLEFMVHIGSTMARSDLGPRWYIAAEGLEPRIISNTANEALDFVFFSNRRKSWDSFANNDVVDLGNAPLLVIPTPSQIIGLNATRKLSIDETWIVLGEPGLEDETSFLAGKLSIRKYISQYTRNKVIKLTIGQPTQDSSEESYHLEVNTFHLSINITGTGNAGVFYGVQTLLALTNNKGEVPQVSIRDSPRFSYRGLMIDVARNFQPKHEILKLLDVMAMYKMNKLHFHLADNEGWRLEIPGIEDLTSVGSRRCHDLQEKTCILSQLGSGPDTSTTGTGYYSTEDYKEILRHANERHIQVIPEFDFPGHSHAAIKSMIARHDRLVKQGKEIEAKEFLISDFKDESRYLSVQLFTDETANSCLNSTYRLIEQVLREVAKLHYDIQPLTIYHFGGDEIPGGAWKKSPECEKLAGKLNVTSSGSHMHKKLKEYFLKRMSNMTAEMNVAIAGWGDFLFEKSTRTLLPREFFPNKEVYSFSWSRTGEAKNLREVPLTANHGYKVVLSSPDYIYLDHPYEPHSDERGKYWATQYTNTRKIFGFMPEDLYKNIGDDKLTCTGSKNCSKEQENVVGVESAIWGETLRTPEHLYSMLFPRLLALAERAWHKASWEEISDKTAREREKAGDWERFANTLSYRELGRLDKMGVPYRVPPPVARIIGTKIETRTALPGLKVQYSRDDGVTWNVVTSNVEVDGKFKLRTRSADDQRVSREVDVEPPKAEPIKKKENDHAKEDKQGLQTKLEKTDLKSEVVDKRSEQNDPAFKAQTDNDRKAKKVKSKNTKQEKISEVLQEVIEPNKADSKSRGKGERSEREEQSEKHREA